MAKRLTDTTKWDKPWFRKLSPSYKCFWQYIIDRCNHAGVWEVDFETAEYYIGEKLDIQPIKEIFNRQYIELNSGNRWLIKDFISFQYGDLNKENRIYISIKNLLKKEGVEIEDIWGIDGAFIKSIPPKSKRKSKRQSKDISKSKEIADPNCLVCNGSGIIKQYDNKVSKCSCVVLKNG